MYRKHEDFNPTQQFYNRDTVPEQSYTNEDELNQLDIYSELYDRFPKRELQRRPRGDQSTRPEYFETQDYDEFNSRNSYDIDSSGEYYSRPTSSQLRRSLLLSNQGTISNRESGNRPQQELFYNEQNLNSPVAMKKENEINSLEEIMEQTTTLAHKIARKKDLETRNIQYQVMLKKSKNPLKHYLNKFQTLYKNNRLWKGGLRIVDYNYGAGVYSYFLFIHWLVYLNFIIFILTSSFIIIPTAVENTKNPIDCDMSNPTSVECCSVEYFNKNSSSNVVSDLFQGTGILEKTLAFIGRYTTDILSFNISSTILYYNIPLAYLATTVVYLLISLFAIFKSLTSGLSTTNSNMELPYSNLIFPSWDFSLDRNIFAEKKHKMIFAEITTTMNIETIESERKLHIAKNKGKIIAVRILANLAVLAILVASAVGIIYVFNFSTEELKKFASENFTDSVEQFCLQFLPSLVIVLLNIVVPFFLQRLVDFEVYSDSFSIRITSIRMVFLRLFSLFILFYTFYITIPAEIEPDKCSTSNVLCWETFIGQQAYKLALTDFGTQIVMTFVFNFARSRIGKLENNFAKFIGEQSFDLPKNVLDIVYMQTVCWFGSFYAPILPAMFTVILFAMFYVKRFACLVNCTPAATNTYRTRSNSMFMQVLLVCFIVALFPVTMTIGNFYPSKSCGPFRNVQNMWVVVTDAIKTIPWLDDIITYVSMTVIPILILLILTLYYYVAIIATNKRRVREAVKELKYWNTTEKPYLIDICKQYKTM